MSYSPDKAAMQSTAVFGLTNGEDRRPGPTWLSLSACWGVVIFSSSELERLLPAQSGVMFTATVENERTAAGHGTEESEQTTSDGQAAYNSEPLLAGNHASNRYIHVVCRGVST